MTDTDAEAVICPVCIAAVGEMCLDAANRIMVVPHAKRRRKAAARLTAKGAGW